MYSYVVSFACERDSHSSYAHYVHSSNNEMSKASFNELVSYLKRRYQANEIVVTGIFELKGNNNDS